MGHIPENLGKERYQLRVFDEKSSSKKIVIGIAGTAKNTGKTTTLNCLLKEAAHGNIGVAITSIGFDGEELDNITLLSKPRIIVYHNTIVTTSEQCLDISTVEVEILDRMGIYTPLGEIVIVRVIRSGLIVVAGPSKKKELQLVIEKMLRYNIGYIFVDGSLNRIVPMSVVDSIIFTTGGSRSIDIAVLSNEMHSIETFFQFPVTPFEEFRTLEIIEIPFLLEDTDVEELIPKLIQPVRTLSIAKYISSSALERLSDLCGKGLVSIHNIIFPDPFTLLILENLIQTRNFISELLKSNISITYRHAPKLLCITANPFLPQRVGHTYVPQYLDSIELLNRLRSVCLTPVFNTQETEPSILLSNLPNAG